MRQREREGRRRRQKEKRSDGKMKRHHYITFVHKKTVCVCVHVRCFVIMFNCSSHTSHTSH